MHPCVKMYVVFWVFPRSNRSFAIVSRSSDSSSSSFVPSFHDRRSRSLASKRRNRKIHRMILSQQQFGTQNSIPSHITSFSLCLYTSYSRTWEVTRERERERKRQNHPLVPFFFFLFSVREKKKISRSQ